MRTGYADLSRTFRHPELFPAYKPIEYVLDIDGDIFQRKAFLISFANSSQWGNNIHIAPNARLDDGLMDVCMVSEFPNMAIPSLVISLLSQSIENNKYDEMIRTSRVSLRNSESLMAHVDGEPIMLPPFATISVEPLALKVVVPPSDFYDGLRFSPARIREQFINTGEQTFNKVKEHLSEIRQMFKDGL